MAASFVCVVCVSGWGCVCQQFGIHFLFCPFLFHTMTNCNQTSVIDATWKPSYVNEVKGHIPRSKVIWGQDVKVAAYVKLIIFVHFFSIQWPIATIIMQFESSVPYLQCISKDQLFWTLCHWSELGRPSLFELGRFGYLHE